jgi:hypothetical protein
MQTSVSIEAEKIISSGWYGKTPAQLNPTAINNSAIK